MEFSISNVFFFKFQQLYQLPIVPTHNVEFFCLRQNDYSHDSKHIIQNSNESQLYCSNWNKRQLIRNMYIETILTQCSCDERYYVGKKRCHHTSNINRLFNAKSNIFNMSNSVRSFVSIHFLLLSFSSQHNWKCRNVDSYFKLELLVWMWIALVKRYTHFFKIISSISSNKTKGMNFLLRQCQNAELARFWIWLIS